MTSAGIVAAVAAVAAVADVDVVADAEVAEVADAFHRRAMVADIRNVPCPFVHRASWPTV